LTSAAPFGLVFTGDGVAAANVPRENLSQFKEQSARFSRHMRVRSFWSGYGLPAAAKRAANAGLLLAYEQTGYDKNMLGRMPRLLEGWSVKRLVEAGANAVKLLLYYSSLSAVETNDRKYAFVEKVGAECAASDVPFFLELVSYGENTDEKSIELRGSNTKSCSRMKDFQSRDTMWIVESEHARQSLFCRGIAVSAGEILCKREQAKHISCSPAAARRFRLFTFPRAFSKQPPFSLDALAAEAGAKFSGVLCGRPRGKMASNFLSGAHALQIGWGARAFETSKT